MLCAGCCCPVSSNSSTLQRNPSPVARMNAKGNKMETNFSLRTIILIALCLQNAVYTVMRKYSTQYEDVSAHEILIVAEVIKILFSVYMIFNETDPAQSDSQGKGVNKLLWLLKNSGKMLMLAVIYGAMNILSFVALQYIGAGEFTICAQLKILTTAGFAVVVLGRTLTPTKWRSLVLLVLGCILVASPSFNSEKGGNPALGYMAVMVEVCLSGFASIYFEKVVKSTTELVTIWERNFQLGFYSLLMYGGIIVYQSYQAGVEIEGGVEGEVVRAAWSGWSLITLSVAVLGAAGGLLVAATLKYADAILKTLASAGAIVIATLLGHYFLSGPLDLIIALGSCVAIVAISDYTLDATPA